MKIVNNKFKNAIKTNGKLISAKIIDNTMVYSKENIVSVDYSYKADLFKSYMRQCDIELLNQSDLKGKSLEVQFGVAENYKDTYEFISYGNFIVKEQEKILDTKTSKLECYDLMLKSMIPYDLKLTYPISVIDYVKAICTRLGWTLFNTSFINSSKMITEEKYDKTYYFRDILDELAQVSVSVVGFLSDNKLHFIYLTETNEIIDFNLRKFSVNKQYGPINSLVLARTPQEDNIFRKDDVSISANGLTEIKIENNQMLNKNRDDFIIDMFNSINGVKYYPFQFESFGVCYQEVCDIFTVKDPITGISYKTILLQDNIQITQGLNELCESNIPTMSKTEYSKASETDRKINKTNLNVDKQNQVITGLVTATDEQGTKITQVTQNVNSVNTKVEDTTTLLNLQIQKLAEIQLSINAIRQSVNISGGPNMFRNSVGLRGLELYNETGTGSIVSGNMAELIGKTVSGAGYLINNKTIEHLKEDGFVIGNTYTITFKYSNDPLNNFKFTLNNLEDIVILNTTEEAKLKEVVYTFIAKSNSISYKFESNYNSAKLFSMYTDFIVKATDIRSSWEPGKGEMLGTALTIYYNGIEVTCDNEPIKVIINNLGFSVVDTDVNGLLITVSQGKVILGKTKAESLEITPFNFRTQTIKGDDVLLIH
ncbi:MAG: hypothetical protein RR406_05000 [Bacilli bacterium]